MQGQINVQTENIFPIIKKFLYSDHEIFLRELVSNSVDATQKLRTLARTGAFKGDIEREQVEIIIDKEAGTLTVRDYGIGMTDKEVDKYINQIAFSGAEEFVNKYKDKADAIIGHFGLGFYSAFMVSDNVEVLSRSHKNKQKAVRWTCDGSPNFTMEDDKRDWIGTDVILHIAEDSKEFLEESRIRGILTKYCKFLPVDIVFGTRTEYEDDPNGEKDEDGKIKQVAIEVPAIINNTNPAWAKKPSQLKEDDYKAFYRELYPMNFEDPLFHIHLNVDYPFNLTGILYFPKLKNTIEVQKNKIQLYSNQVFITDSVEDIVPEFLTLLHGVIDSPDIPLNVSRSYLQSDHNVKKISNHIMKKVGDKLEQMFKKDRDDFVAKWDDIRTFMEYGMLTEDKFYDRAIKFSLLKNTAGEYFTVDEYTEKIKATQTDKDNRLVYLYASNAEEQHTFVEAATERGYDVLEMGGPLASHFVSMLEQKLEGASFARVDSDTIDNLIKKEETQVSKLSEKEEEKLKPIIEGVLPAEKFIVQFESMSEKDAPMIITQSEFTRRMKEQSQVSGQNMFGGMPEMYNLVVNSNHPLIGKILTMRGKKKDKVAKQAADLALLSQGMLKGKDLNEFIKRSVEIIEEEN